MLRSASWATRAPVGRLGPGHRQEPRRALVEPVHNARPIRRADPGRHQRGQVGKARQQPADQGPLLVPGSRMHHQAGRLVDDGHLGVGVDHGELHAGFRLHARAAGSGRAMVRMAPSRRALRPTVTTDAVDQDPPRRR